MSNARYINLVVKDANGPTINNHFYLKVINQHDELTYTPIRFSHWLPSDSEAQDLEQEDEESGKIKSCVEPIKQTSL